LSESGDSPILGEVAWGLGGQALSIEDLLGLSDLTIVVVRGMTRLIYLQDNQRKSQPSSLQSQSIEES